MAAEEGWCVVTGGRGFAARHLVEMLIRYNNYCVRIADLGPTIELEPSEQLGLLGQAMHSGRAQYISLDLRDKAQVLKGNNLFSLTLLSPQYQNNQRILFYFSSFFFLVCLSLQHLKELRLCSIWLLRILPLTTTSCIILSMSRVKL